MTPERSRHTDPRTSHDAEPTTGLRERQAAVYRLVRDHGPLSDERLVELYGSTPGLPRQSESGIRTRRHELALAGHLIRDSYGQTRAGNRCALWRVAVGTGAEPAALFDPPQPSRSAIFD